MLRSCLASAAADGSVCVFLEPIALYHTRDLYQQGDNEWLAPYAAPSAWAAEHVPIGRARTYPVGTGGDLTILTYGNGLRMSLRVAARLAAEGYGSRVVDLRWLSPLPAADLVREAGGDRPGADRRRDPALRRRRRRHPRGPGGRRFRRRGQADRRPPTR